MVYTHSLIGIRILEEAISTLIAKQVSVDGRVSCHQAHKAMILNTYEGITVDPTQALQGLWVLNGSVSQIFLTQHCTCPVREWRISLVEQRHGCIVLPVRVQIVTYGIILQII